MKRFFLLFSIILLLIATTKQLSGQNNSWAMVDKVVIDAGHGGHDPGALGRRTREKDIALSIALKTGQYIEKNLPDVKVIYTRSTDKFVELYKRAQIANENHADLFISIHCNSNASSKAYGTETFVMGLHKSKDNLEVAKKENNAILLEDNYSVQYGGYNPNSEESHIMFNFFQSAYQEQSLTLASGVQTQLEKRVGRHNRGVKQAGFLVLYKVAMPGILVEAGFLSNPKEEQFLRTDDGQSYIASAIYRAFKQYKTSVEIQNHITVAAPLPPQTQNQNSQTTDTTKRQQQITTQSEPITLPDQKICFRVQFASSRIQDGDKSKAFKNVQNIFVYQDNGRFKYTCGDFTSIKKAKTLQNEIRLKGYKDAFVIALKNNKRIPVKEALKSLK